MPSFWLFADVCNLSANISEHSVRSEMLALKLQAPVNNPEKRI
jgi:hypothetical protein